MKTLIILVGVVLLVFVVFPATRHLMFRPEGNVTVPTLNQTLVGICLYKQKNPSYSFATAEGHDVILHDRKLSEVLSGLLVDDDNKPVDESFFRDYWGSSLICVARPRQEYSVAGDYNGCFVSEDDEEFFLYSVGPNRLDESGFGDDIVASASVMGVQTQKRGEK